MVAVAALSMSFSANAEPPKWEVVAGMNVANSLKSIKNKKIAKNTVIYSPS